MNDSTSKKDLPYFRDNLQFSSYMITPESGRTFPELNKDISISDLKPKWQRVILIKSRVAHYINQIFSNTPVFLGYDETGDAVFEETPEKKLVAFQSITGLSFIRDVMAVAVTSQALGARLLRAMTENKQQISHDYSMDKKYKKNIGE